MLSLVKNKEETDKRPGLVAKEQPGGALHPLLKMLIVTFMIPSQVLICVPPAAPLTLHTSSPWRPGGTQPFQPSVLYLAISKVFQLRAPLYFRPKQVNTEALAAQT